MEKSVNSKVIGTYLQKKSILLLGSNMDFQFLYTAEIFLTKIQFIILNSFAAVLSGKKTGWQVFLLLHQSRSADCFYYRRYRLKRIPDKNLT